MTVEIAKHLRIIRTDLDDDFVRKRQKAVTTVARSFRKRSVASDVLALSDAVVKILASTTLEAPDTIKNEVASAIAAEAPAFVPEDATLEIGVCALLAAAVALDMEKPAKAATFNVPWFARAVTLGMATLPPRQEPRIEALRTDLTTLGTDALQRQVDQFRIRSEVSSDFFSIKEDETPDAHSKRVLEEMKPLVAALLRNAELDREELDALWWAFGGRSEVLGCAIGDAEPRAAAVANGVELARLIRGPVGEAHGDIAMRGLPKAANPFALTDFLTLAHGDATKIVAKLSMPAVKNYPALFPLLAAVYSAAEGKKDAPVVNDERRPLEHWAHRALYETWLARSTLEA